METKVKLVKVEEGGYKCRPTYEWQGHIIEGDDIGLGGSSRYWYCDTLFKGSQFRTLRGLKNAIKLMLEGKLTKWALMSCEDE